MSAQSTEVATRTPMQQAIAEVRAPQFVEQIRNALPGNVTPERFVRVAVTALQQAPELVATDRTSLYGAIIRCAQDGLLPDGREAALVKFGNDAAYLPMVGGLRKVAAKHGITLNAYVVYENDEFDYTLGEAPHIHHKPPKLNAERGEPIGAYAVATFQDGTMVCPPEVMSKQEIEKVRAVSKAKGSGPWTQWWDQMARKSVARRLFKQLPLGDLDEQAARIIDAADADADLDRTQHLTVDEANVAATLSNGRPPADTGPDDTAAPATPAQHGQLLELVVQLTDVDAETDWQAEAVTFAEGAFGRTMVELTGREMDGVLEHLRDQLPTVEDTT